MAYTKEYKIDLKAIAPLYPDAENSKVALEQIIAHIRTTYENMRNSLMTQGVYEASMNKLNGIPPRESAHPFVEYPSFDDAVTTGYAVAMGTTYNEVVTVNATITMTSESADAVKLLNNVVVIGTFDINPSYRITGY